MLYRSTIGYVHSRSRIARRSKRESATINRKIRNSLSPDRVSHFMQTGSRSIAPFRAFSSRLFVATRSTAARLLTTAVDYEETMSDIRSSFAFTVWSDFSRAKRDFRDDKYRKNVKRAHFRVLRDTRYFIIYNEWSISKYANYHIISACLYRNAA